MKRIFRPWNVSILIPYLTLCHHHHLLICRGLENSLLSAVQRNLQNWQDNPELTDRHELREFIANTMGKPNKEKKLKGPMDVYVKETQEKQSEDDSGILMMLKGKLCISPIGKDSKKSKGNMADPPASTAGEQSQQVEDTGATASDPSPSTPSGTKRPMGVRSPTEDDNDDSKKHRQETINGQLDEGTVDNMLLSQEITSGQSNGLPAHLEHMVRDKIDEGNLELDTAAGLNGSPTRVDGRPIRTARRSSVSMPET